ncbi:male-specific lethal 1-like 1 isoform X3 [Macrobrachium nipponense]|uniref:male-specific lethal 1-like 1 isoform X3 n=1 Tax=Macrobrachium nipponense TaxID=159736 RepID=UPI0030C7DE4F
MPRGLSLYNGENDEIEASVVPVEKTDGVTAADGSRQPPLDRVTSSMTTNEKAENRIAAMAVEFDHMYLGCSETKASIGKDIEVQHLKDLLLLHLDLIQQQAEQLVAKDKLIKSLRDENEHLRSRLDRIDRRVSLSLNKKSSESTSVELKQEIVSEEDQPDSQLKQLGSPSAKSDVQANKVLSPSNKNASSSKLPCPSNKSSPSSKPASPTSKSVSPASKVVSPATKPTSPQPKTVTSLPDEEAESPPVSTVDGTSSVESSSPRSGGPSRLNRKSSSRPVVQKALLREKRQRNTSQSQSSENETEVEPLKDVSKSVSDKERPRLKRRSESETETSPVKRIRTERERSGHVKDDGLTDHNLRSRDKSRDRLKSTSKQEEFPPSPVVRAPTPTPRAAALEAKKLRQKLQLKEQSVQGQTFGRKGGKTPGAVTVRGDGILNTTVTYFLPYGSYIHDPNPEEECLQAQVEIPRWGTRILTSLYVMEGTENLEDEIFIKRHAKPEQDEKRRKRWDLQRMREQRHYERLRERYESRQSANEPTVSGSGSLWPCPESAMYLHVEDTLPVCAFGQPLARIPPQEFTIPWLTGHGLEGVSTRRRKR